MKATIQYHRDNHLRVSNSYVYNNKNVHGICTKVKCRYELYSAVKLSMFLRFDKDFASCLLTCFVACLAIEDGKIAAS